MKNAGSKRFAVIDAAMNDLARPAIYGAYHDIVAVALRGGQSLRYDIVGPVCESTDTLGHERDLNIAQGDLLAIMSAGAYGMSMASNYNTRPRAAEVLVAGDTMRLVRSRESLQDLFAHDILPS